MAPAFERGFFIALIFVLQKGRNPITIVARHWPAVLLRHMSLGMYLPSKEVNPFDISLWLCYTISTMRNNSLVRKRAKQMHWFCIPHARHGDAHCSELSMLTFMGNKQCIPCFQYQKGCNGVQPRYQLPVTMRTALWSVYHRAELSDWVLTYGTEAC